MEELDKIESGPFGQVKTFGDTLMQISRNGWINGIAFSPDCNTLCFVTHDCEISFEDVSQIGQEAKSKPNNIDSMFHNGNPHLSCMFIDDSKLIATGFDKVPYLYKKQNGKWA